MLSTTTPVDMIAPFAEALGFDDLIATAYETKDGRYTGRLYEGFVWGTGKLRAVRAWADEHGIDLADCHACSDSIFDVPLLSSVGSPHAVNPDPSLTVVATARRWPVEHWDRPPGRPQRRRARAVPHAPAVRPQAVLPLRALRHRRRRARAAPAARCCWPRTTAATSTWPRWRSWPATSAGRCASSARRRSSTRRSSGSIARAIGGIPVDRGSGSGQPLRAAESALKAGEVVIVLPQGTIPRGYDFFDPVLHGKTGTARLAASTGATVVPVGLWGTEKVWPRSARVPDFTLVRNPPTVTVRVGKPVPLSLTDAKADTADDHGGHQRAAARRVAGAPRADPRGAGPHQAPSVRARLASATTRAVNAASRRLGRGQGTVAGGRAGLRLDPRLLEHLSAGRQVALVTGHQREDHDDPAAHGGARRDGRRRREQRDRLEHAPGPRGRAGRARDAPRAVLEVDEVYLPRVLTATAAAAVVLLNLSRDQLDRTNEVRMVAGRWRAALAAAPHTHVVANADDPLVVWGAGAARDVHWVGAGLRWQHDAVGCPSCEGRIEFARRRLVLRAAAASPAPTPRRRSWSRPDGAAARPSGPTGGRAPVRLALPGRFNQANALMAAVAAEACGVDAARGARRHGVGARRWPAASPCASFGDVRARLMLAKNPAGWDELLDLVAGSDGAARRQHQRAGRRRRRPELAVGRALRAAGRAAPSWPPATATATCRCACTTRGVAPHDRARPGAAQWPTAAAGGDPACSSTSSGTTPPSTTCSGAPR